jgi:collagenase-like PrtC family protease
VKTKDIQPEERHANLKELNLPFKPSSGKKLIVRVYNRQDAMIANHYADIIAVDMFQQNYDEIKRKVRKPLYAVTPRIMFDSDLDKIRARIKDIAPQGLIAGNLGIANMDFNLPIILDYNSNCFNDLQLSYYHKIGTKPIMSPELSITELEGFKNKDFIVFAHGRLRLMTLAHDIKEQRLRDEKGTYFDIKRIFNGSELVHEKELGLLNKVRGLVKAGINQIYLDPSTNHNFENVILAYRGLLDEKNMDVSGLQSGTMMGWINRGAE